MCSVVNRRCLRGYISFSYGIPCQLCISNWLLHYNHESIHKLRIPYLVETITTAIKDRELWTMNIQHVVAIKNGKA